MVGKPLVAAAAVAVLACSRYAAPTESWQTRVNQLVASGDTAGALAHLDTVVARYPRDAAAWHRMGMLAWEQIRPHWHGKVSHSQPHIHLMARADSALRLAHAHAPDSGRYAFDLGRYFLFGGLITLRVQALGKFELAVDAARRVGDSALVSEAADEIGMAFWRRYEAVAHRRLITTGVNTFPVFALSERRAVKDWLQNSTQPLPEPSGQLDYLKATDWFRVAQAADPRAERPARHIFMALAEQEQWEELSSAATARIAVEPNDATAWFARGLAAHRRSNYPVATTAFEHALGLLDPAAHDRVTNLSRILGPKDSLAYVAFSANQRAEFERLYWTAADPMTLTADNEHRLEFLARVAYSDFRWTSEDFVLRGADSDRGEIHIRYGPPPVIVSLPPQIGGAVGHVMWYYPATNLHMIFRQPPSYGYATYAFEYHEEAREARYVAPVRWTNVPITVAMDSVQVQAVRFRGSGDSTDLALFAHVPIRRLVDGLDLTSGTVDVAFTLYRGAMHAIGRDSVRQIVDTRAPDAVERRTWRRRLAPGEVAYRIEALQTEGGAAARAFGSVSLTSDGGFGMSDVLVADRVTPPADSAYRWTDLLIEPSAGVLEPGQDIGVAWETYGLTERDGQVAYRVELQLTVTQVTGRKSLYARIKGGLADLIGLSAVGTDRVSLVYDRSRPASAVALDYLTLDLAGSPIGRYRLTVQITDLATNAQTFSNRELVIEPVTQHRVRTASPQAPGTGAAPTDARMTAVDSLLLAGDTVAALARVAAIIEEDKRNATAWHRQGELALLLARPPGTKITWNTRTIRYMDLADSSLARAGYLAPDSARYHLTRGMYFLASGAPMVMVAAAGSFRRGLAAAQRVEDSTMVAELAIQLGLRYWKTYEGVSHRRGYPNVSLPELVSQADTREELDHLIDIYFPQESTEPAERYYLAARDFFLIALGARPDSRRAWTYAYMTLLALDAWEELEAASLVRIGSAPDDAWAWMARGLASHWRGKDSESARAFRRGLEIFEPDERRRLTRVSRLLRPTDRERIDTLSEPQQLATELVFWRFSDPLTVTPENEHWLEFLSRVTYAELMFSVEELTLLGADTPRGEVFVRYGKPRDILGTMGAGGYGILWRYSNGLDFFFQMGVLRTVNEDGFAPLRKHFERVPHSFANVPITSEMESIPSTVTRFRGPADSTEAFIATSIPVGELTRGVDLREGTLKIAFISFAGTASPLVRDTSSVNVRFEDDRRVSAPQRMAWRQRFATPDLGYRIEAYQVESGKAARAVGAVMSESAAGFGISDLLLADELKSAGSTPERWSDLEIQPNLGTIEQGEDLALAWETYDLAADSSRSSEYSVEISLVRTDGLRLGRAIARVIGGTLGRGEGRGRDDRVAVSFDRRVPSRPVTLDYLTLSLGELDPGRYRLTITVTDAVRNVSAESVRELVIER